MPATKTKRTTKAAKSKVYDNKLYRQFERPDRVADEDDAFFREYYFRRRHLAWGRSESGERMLKYEIESGCLDEMLFDGLALIKERDGDQIFDEVSRDLLIEALTSIEYLRGSLPNSWRGLLQALCVERRADEAKIDAWVLQQRRDDGSTALVA
jgi:hypothetical protein